MKSWRNYLKSRLGEPLPYDKITRMLGNSIRLSRTNFYVYANYWYIKNGFAVDYVSTQSSHIFFFFHIGTRSFTRAEHRLGSSADIRYIIRAIANPNLWPLCINIDWAKPIVDCALKPLELKESQ